MNFAPIGRSLALILSILLANLVALAQSRLASVPGEVLIKFKGKSGSAQSGRGMQKASQKFTLKSSFGKLNLQHFKVKPGEDFLKAIDELKQDPDVAYVEPNYYLDKMEVQELGSREQVFSREDIVEGTSVKAYSHCAAPTKLVESWAIAVPNSTSSERPIVAVIDTGVDMSHSILVESSAIWSNEREIPGNNLDDDGDGYRDDVHGWNFFAETNDPTDDDGHGTHVSGIIVGTGQDIFVAHLDESKIRIMPLKFLGADGSGTTANAIRAIYYAVNNGAQVINNSWGGANYSASLLEAMTFAYNHGVALVSASGNSGKNNDVAPMYPANYSVPSNLSVAASNDWDYLASFSNYGANTVHLASPGVSIFSTIPGDLFTYMSGTSMAAPFVSGMVAMALREAPQSTGYQLHEIVVNQGVQSIQQLQGKVITAGRINSLSIVATAQGMKSLPAEQPAYGDGADRDPAADSGSPKAGGCGLVGGLGGLGLGGGGAAGNPWGLALFALMLALPAVMWWTLRRQAKAPTRESRKYDRFVMDSEIKIKVGGRELIGNMKTISVGGLSFSADTLLDKGGVVTMSIASPDGQQQIEVQGRIVWNEANKAYGVQFAEVQSAVAGWSQALVKAK